MCYCRQLCRIIQAMAASLLGVERFTYLLPDSFLLLTNHMRLNSDSYLRSADHCRSWSELQLELILSNDAGVCVCLGGPVGNPGRRWRPASGGGALLCGGGDRGGHQELCEVCPQSLRCGKNDTASCIHHHVHAVGKYHGGPFSVPVESRKGNK